MNVPEHYSKNSIPERELAALEKTIRTYQEYYDVEYVRAKYESLGLKPLLDPFGKDILAPIKEALLKRAPFSAIRIGDGEANFLALGAYEGTPNLDRHAFSASIAGQPDTFRVTETWMLVLRDMMQHALLSADIVGVLGLWRPMRVKDWSIDNIIDKFHNRPRGITGHWRGVDLMLRRAKAGHFKAQILAPAHLYFAAISHLEGLIPLTDRVICITDKQPVVEALQQKFQKCQFRHIAVGKWCGPKRTTATEPGFLSDVEAQLPTDLAGCLCLVGAGVWAEFYCTWIKQRGGVAIDIGSGFDLLAGNLSRRMHRLIPQSILTPLNIVTS